MIEIVFCPASLNAPGTSARAPFFVYLLFYLKRCTLHTTTKPGRGGHGRRESKNAGSEGERSLGATGAPEGNRCTCSLATSALPTHTDSTAPQFTKHMQICRKRTSWLINSSSRYKPLATAVNTRHWPLLCPFTHGRVSGQSRRGRRQKRGVAETTASQTVCSGCSDHLRTLV